MQIYYLKDEMKALITGMQEKRLLTPDGDYYSKATIRNWNSKLSAFLHYGECLGAPIKLSDINYAWYEDYKLCLMQEGYSKNSIGNILSVLKAFVKRMFSAGKMAYNGFGMRCGGEITTAIVVTVDEIKKLMALNLAETPGYERIRDVFVCQCFLGLRVSDMRKLIKDLKIHIVDIDGKKVVEIQTNKKANVVAIPLSPVILEIAEKRNYDFGKTLTQQYYHKAMRHLIKLAGIDREIMFRRTEGGERIERKVLFSNLAGTHTARRTFATNAYLAGVPVLDIMQITGHRSFNSFYRYIRCEGISVALRVHSHPFFNIEMPETLQLPYIQHDSIDN